MHILLAIDGSEQSFEAAQALRYLSHLESVLILHTVHLPRPSYPLMSPEGTEEWYQTTERRLHEEGEALLEQMSKRLPPDAGQVSIRLETGTPAGVIISTAEKERTDLILMGATGRNLPYSEALFGSTTHRVVTYAPCSVLVVKRLRPALRQVLLAVEGREDGDAAVAFLAKRPLRDSSPVEVMTVIPIPEEQPENHLTQMMRRSAQRFVEDIAAKLSTFRCCATAAAVTGQPAAGVLHHAAAINADLILVGTKARPGDSRFLLGSVSHRILAQAACPVLVIR